MRLRRQPKARTVKAAFRVKDAGLFRPLRNSEIEFEEKSEDLQKVLRRALVQRQLGEVIRVEMSASLPEGARELIIEGLKAGRDLARDAQRPGGDQTQLNLRLAGYGGDVATVGVPMVEVWGMTETCATFTSHTGWEYVARPDSCGPAAPMRAYREFWSAAKRRSFRFLMAK